jgi:hypothetical protein
MMPEMRRIIVKLLGTIVFSPSANRHNTEFAAKAKRAKVVEVIIFIFVMFKR